MRPTPIAPDGRVALLEDEHAAELFERVDENRAYLRQWMPWLDGTRSVDDIRDFIRAAHQRREDNGGLEAGIWHRDKLCGVIGVHPVDTSNRSTSLGYWIAEECQGLGLVTGACRAVVDHLFGELELNRIVIRCAAGNGRSRGLPERLGFTLEGVLRQNEWLYDHFVDHECWSLLRNEWVPGTR